MSEFILVAKPELIGRDADNVSAIDPKNEFDA